jgi:hypothetical protein
MFKIEMSPKLYYSIRNNQFLQKEDLVFSESDTKEYERFKKTWEEFENKLNNQDPIAFSILSNLMNFWGYNRRYCGMCGRPIIGRPEHIQNRIVCCNCYKSYEITENLLKQDNIIKDKLQQRDNKGHRAPHYDSQKKENPQKNFREKSEE